MGNSSVVAAVISAIGGIGASYIAYRYNQNRSRRRSGSTFSVLEGYEKLLRDQQKEISRKSDIIDRLDSEVTQLQGMIGTLKTDLSDTKNQNFELRRELESFKNDYKAANL